MRIIHWCKECGEPFTVVAGRSHEGITHHNVQTMQLKLRTRGKGNRRDVQWSTDWERDVDWSMPT